MTTEAPAEATANITSIEDAATVRWLARVLAPARNRLAGEPSDEALERVRARVFGEQPRKARTLAA
jgi:hypothetical protein